MWTLKKPEPVKLIIGIFATNEAALKSAAQAVIAEFGKADFVSDVWPFNMTRYYEDEAGNNLVKQFVSIEKLIHPSKLAKIKHITNRLEKKLTKTLKTSLPRPVNLDPGIIEPSKLILATTKNFSHRIYIGKKMYAEVTLTFNKGVWKSYDYTFADHKQQCYHDFFNISHVRFQIFIFQPKYFISIIFILISSRF